MYIKKKTVKNIRRKVNNLPKCIFPLCTKDPAELCMYIFVYTNTLFTYLDSNVCIHMRTYMYIIDDAYPKQNVRKQNY